MSWRSAPFSRGQEPRHASPAANPGPRRRGADLAAGQNDVKSRVGRHGAGIVADGRRLGQRSEPTADRMDYFLSDPHPPWLRAGPSVVLRLPYLTSEAPKL